MRVSKQPTPRECARALTFSSFSRRCNATLVMPLALDGRLDVSEKPLRDVLMPLRDERPVRSERPLLCERPVRWERPVRCDRSLR